jgi:hypothetical protein
MPTKKKKTKTVVAKKKNDCTAKDIMSGIGELAVAGSILLGSITIYKMVVHLIAINKLS